MQETSHWGLSFYLPFSLPTLPLIHDKYELTPLFMSSHPAMMVHLTKAMEFTDYTLSALKLQQESHLHCIVLSFCLLSLLLLSLSLSCSLFFHTFFITLLLPFFPFLFLFSFILYFSRFFAYRHSLII